MTRVPDIRIRATGNAPANAEGDYVLYWMIANRRVRWNYSLQRAVEWAVDLKKPLVVLEALRTDYRWASDRLHCFVMQGMASNAQALFGAPALYVPYLEPSAGAGKGLLGELSKRACVVISDDYPCFFLPRMLRAAQGQIPVRFELIDSNGLLPMRAADKVFSRAFDFRRFLQKTLRPHLDDFPEPNPLAGVSLPVLKNLPTAIAERWPAAHVGELAGTPGSVSRFPIDHKVSGAPLEGGSSAAEGQLQDFVKTKLANYDSRNQPERDVNSGLSPHLHFGHVSAHQVFAEVTGSVGWSPHDLGDTAKGSAHGWWGASDPVEAFLDQLITWRELGYNMCWQRDDFDQYDSLPNWARKTLAEHENDRREHVYGHEEFEAASTHDELWNAAQRQLVREGRIHNYLRMLWGKKVLEWSANSRAALDIMIELNNKYALDGRDPNSYSGIFWVLGRYDRAWGPERAVFGKIRYMSSENTARKLRVKRYLHDYAA